MGFAQQDGFDAEMQIDFDDDRFSNQALLEEAHNVSLDGLSTPKKVSETGPIFDENEFAPETIEAPRVEESAMARRPQDSSKNKPSGKKLITKAEYAKQLREQKKAQFEERRAKAMQRVQ